MGFLHQHPCRSLCHIHDFPLCGGSSLYQRRASRQVRWHWAGLLAVWLGALQIILDKGQEDDWFGATWIRWAAAILLTSFVSFLIREFRHKQPLVDLRVFRHRNFAIGCLLIGLFGAGIYALVTLLPLFYQELMGYTALAAGWAVSPRGIGAIVAMPIIGYLTAKIDNRWLIAFGFSMFGAASLWFGEVNLSIGQWTFLWAILISGFGSGCVFVPLQPRLWLS